MTASTSSPVLSTMNVRVWDQDCRAKLRTNTRDPARHRTCKFIKAAPGSVLKLATPAVILRESIGNTGQDTAGTTCMILHITPSGKVHRRLACVSSRITGGTPVLPSPTARVPISDEAGQHTVLRQFAGCAWER